MLKDKMNCTSMNKIHHFTDLKDGYTLVKKAKYS